MEELKNKILSLINKQTPKIPSMGFSDANYHFNDMPTLSINSKTVSEANRRSDQDILESIEAAYFSLDENYDITKFELSKLPEQLDCSQIKRDFDNLKQQHQVVSKKVLQLILEHQNSCNEEFKNVLEILNKIKETSELCTKSRRELNLAKREYEQSLYVLANYRKRKLAQNLLNNLKMIKNLYNFDKRLNILLNQGDYVGAITELQRCQKVANNYQNFNCVSALTYKLQETMENTDHQLDRALAQTCLYFNGDHFGKLQNAFRLMEKSQSSVIDNLHVHYITAISNQSMNVVQSYVDNCELVLSNSSVENPYETLCQSVPQLQEVFIRCLLDLCKVLFKIVLSYHQLINWYNDKNGENCDSPDREKTKLENNLTKIWDDVQRKVGTLLSNVDLTQYGIDQFVQVLRIVHRLIQVGDEFCLSKSDSLMKSIEVQCETYFRNYHATRMDELRIVFENEIWEVCPVKPTFNILQLREFQSLRSLLRNFKLRVSYTSTNSPQANNVPASVGSNDCCSSTHSHDGCSSIYGNYFVRYVNHGTPFDSGLDDNLINEDILDENDASGYFSEESDDESEEINKDSGDDETSTSSKISTKRKECGKAPILTNTTLQVIHQMGKYLQMSRLLKPIAYKIVICMNEFFYYYLYVVNLFFASDLQVSSQKLYSNQLTKTLKKITETSIIHGHGHETVSDDEKVQKPILSCSIDLKKHDQLHGLYERIVAVESLIYLATQYRSLQEFIEFLVPQTHKSMLDQFFQQDVACAVDLRKPVYMSVCAQAFDLIQILSKMSKINWDIKEVREQHNDYIDILLREVQIFTLRLEKITNKLQVPGIVYNALWENIAHIITHTLVQGFAEAKKCSNAGRALMQLDFAQFLDKFEKMSGLKPVPHKAYVDNYLKAYYLPEYELENWIKEHNEYSTKHFLGLVNCVCQNNKKTRLRLEQMIEEMDKNNNTLDR